MFDYSSLILVLGERRILLTAIFLVLISVARWLLIRLIRGGADIMTENQRRWINQVKNGFFVVVLLGLAFVWLPEIETFALSITAVAVAFVIATKELILCVSGTVYRASSNLFQVGDWIEIGTHFGEVVDHNLASTTLQEIDRNEYVHTGQSVTLPNSFLLTNSIVNHSFQKRYVFLAFELTTELDANPYGAIEPLTELIKTKSNDFAEVALRYNALIERRSGIDIPGPEPRFTVTTNEIAKPVLKVTVFCPTERACEFQQAVTKEFFGWYFSNRVSGSNIANRTN